MLSELLSRGGPVMYVLLICSVVAVAIIAERFWFWITESRRVPKDKIGALVTGRTFDEGSEAVSPILQQLLPLQKAGKASAVAHLLMKESERAYERAIKLLSGLDTVVSIAPLLGILGTVLGIMKAFHALDFQHMSSPGEVGHGLAEAMLTTAAGLAIAVPTLVFYNLFHSLATRHAATLYKLAQDIEDSPVSEEGEE